MTNKIALSVSTSLISKIVTLISQLVVIRILINQIGVDGFGLYSIYLAVTGGYVALCGCTGPVITRKVSSCSKNDLQLMIVSSISATFIVSLGVQLLFMLGWSYANKIFHAEIKNSFAGGWVFMFIGFLLSIASVSDSIRLGQEKNHINNIVGVFINISQFLLTVLLCKYGTVDIEFLAIVYFVPSVIIKLISLAKILSIKSLCAKEVFKAVGQAVNILRDARKFSLGVISGFISVNLLVFVISKSGNMDLVAEYSLFMKYVSIVSGVLIMFTTPIWPMIYKEIKSENLCIAYKMYKKYGSLFLSYTLIACVLSVAFLNEIFILWTGAIFEYSLLTRMLFSAYLLLYLISHVLYIGLISLGASLKISLPALVESLISLSLVLLYGIDAGLNTILIILAITNLTVVIGTYSLFIYIEAMKLKFNE